MRNGRSRSEASDQQPTPGVAHNNPVYRRYQGAVIFGTDSRAAVDDLLGSPHVTELVGDQYTACTAVHAFNVERSVPVIGMRA
jgi:hypothetical protein